MHFVYKEKLPFLLSHLIPIQFFHHVQVTIAGSIPYETNGLPKDSALLKVHCASKDTDIGYKTITVSGRIQWSFHANIVGSTIFFCRFWWKNNDKAYEVFNMGIANSCDLYLDSYRCIYQKKN
ncbi:hypothetical protein M9H77_35940 [Catharanthus roseus]|uniref:Uncharacterized protein n=1 Tax=Catharanthus roseus TaxID=4058 RepID=A0ACB9ZR86_CATRO|nr:hypothetical protein M9H77_35940 [Catharanthus roseus]